MQPLFKVGIKTDITETVNHITKDTPTLHK